MTSENEANRVFNMPDEFEQELRRLFPPLTDKELLEIFPEAKEMILLKLAEWREEREKVLSDIQEKLALLKREAKDDFTYFFYREVLKYFDGKELLGIDKRIARLQRLLNVYDGRENKAPFDAAQKEDALKVPIQSLTPQPLRKGNKNYSGLCPFHEDRKPSFYVYPDTNSFYCFGCHKGGDVIRFVEMLHGFNFSQAIKFLITGGHYEYESTRA